MDMKTYLREIEYAATTVIKLVWDEHAQLNELDGRIQAATKQMEEGYRFVQFLNDNPDLDDDNLATAVHWDTYFGPDKERHYALKDQERLEDLFSTRAFSRAAQSASL